MKQFITILLLSIGVCGSVDAKQIKYPLMASDTVVWAGLDYSLARMVGGNDSEFGFNSPDTLFPGMLERWNQLFLDERTELLAHTLNRRVFVDISGVTERNKQGAPNQIISTPGPEHVLDKSHITPQDITAEVQSYNLKKTNGLGLVFIVDRLVCGFTVFADGHVGKAPPADNLSHLNQSSWGSGKGGAVYVVFFDIATREVISIERKVYGVSSGGNFRNYWFGPIKDTDSSLGKYRLSESYKPAWQKENKK